MSRFVVTGGAGFVGAAVVKELLELGHEAVVFDRPWDVRDPNDVLNFMEGAYAVIHLAGVLGTHELFDQIDLAVDVNIKGTVNVLEACRVHGIHYVGITMPQVFPSVYTATKMAAQRLASAFHQAYGVPVSHVRAFNVFGPGQKYGPGHPQKIIPTFAMKILRGEAVPIWGNGHQTVDLIHVQELATMMVDAVRFGDDFVFDGGTGKSHSVLDVARMVGAIIGTEPVLEFRPMRRGERPSKLVARGDGWDRLGWSPSFRISDLSQTVAWYHQFAAKGVVE